MSDADRIAELQRIVFGAGATDDERTAAARELAVLQRREAGPSAAGPTSGGDDERAPEAGATDLLGIGLPTGAPADGTDARPDPEGAMGSTTTVSAVTRWAVLVGVIALAIGFGAGWASGSIAATTVLGETAGPAGGSPTGGDDVVLPLVGPVEQSMPIEETGAVELFDRPATEADLLVDPALFGDSAIDPASPRLLATRSDGVDVWAARTLDGELCLLMRIDDVSGASSCTVGGTIGPEGVGVETFIQSRGYFAVWLEQSGDLRIRVEGVGPQMPS